jgi:hypothetical protein
MSYIQEAFFKAFSYLGYEVFWFHDKDYPEDFDWEDCIFWTEGFADSKIPLVKSSTYLVHGPPDPAKYINAEVKRFIDFRYNHIWHKDHIYDFTLDKSKVQKVGNSCYFEPKSNKSIKYKNDYHEYEIADYDKFYITWGASLLPHEFNFKEIKRERERVIHFCGNLSPDGRCENFSTFSQFIMECRKADIPFYHNDPFRYPLPEEEVQERTKLSILAADVRGPEHLRNGYVPCRVFKSASWGHLPMTNSKEIHSELEGHCLLQEDPAQLFHDAMAQRENYAFIEDCMKYVKDNHTYLNRIKSILKVL